MNGRKQTTRPFDANTSMAFESLTRPPGTLGTLSSIRKCQNDERHCGRRRGRLKRRQREVWEAGVSAGDVLILLAIIGTFPVTCAFPMEAKLQTPQSKVNISLPAPRSKPANFSGTALKFFMPIPAVDEYWTPLVSTMYMALDELQGSPFSNLWVDLNVTVIGNQLDAVRATQQAIVDNHAIGVIGDGTFSATIDVCDQYGIPLCDGLDTSSILSNHNLYPSFFRTTPSNSQRIGAICALISFLAWKEFSIITADTFEDTGEFFTRAHERGLTISNVAVVKPADNNCSSLSLPPGSNGLVVFLGVPFPSAVSCLKQLFSLPDRENITWILGEELMEVDLAGTSYEGAVYSVVPRGGIGPRFEELLTRWNSSSYKAKYPEIARSTKPLPSFMYYRSCLELLMNGYNRALELRQLSAADISKGYSAQLGTLFPIPGSISDNSFETIAGSMTYTNGSDALGTFSVKMLSSSQFVNIGILDTTLAVNISTTIPLSGRNNSFFQPPSPNALQGSIVNLGLILGITLGSLALVLGFGVWLFWYKLKKWKVNQNEKSKQDLNHTTIGIDVMGTGQQALDILGKLKTNMDKHQRAFLTKDEIDVFTEALTSGSAYHPTFDQYNRGGSELVDKELQEFLMNTMLAQSKKSEFPDHSAMRQTSPSTSKPAIRSREASNEPALLRETSLFSKLKSRTQSVRSNRSGEVELEKAISEGSIHGTQNSDQEISAISAKVPQVSPSQTSPTRTSAPSQETRDSPLNASKPDLSRNMSMDSRQKAPIPRSRPNFMRSSLNEVPPATMFVRRISVLAANVFNPSTDVAKQGPSVEHNNKEFLVASSISIASMHVADANRSYEESRYLTRPSENLESIKTAPVQEYLEQTYLTWTIDMFKLHDLTEGHPLYFSGSWLIDRTDILSRFKIPVDKFKKWLLIMEREYSPLPYHNCIHAADVLQSFNYLAFNSQWGSKFTPMEKISSIIAAIGHDIHHTGVSNQFLVKSRNSMAVLYSDLSVNEFHHSAHMFSVTLNSNCNIFSDLSVEEYEEMRRIIVRLILATDMGKHFEIISKFKTKTLSPGFKSLETQESRLMVLEMALKCSDLNNPTKPLEIAVQWSACVMEEFYRQGDKERQLGLPISNFMDRLNTNVAKCQLGFIDLLVAPLFNTWIAFNMEDSVMNVVMKSNIRQTKQLWQTASLPSNADQSAYYARSTAISIVAKSNSSLSSAPADVPPEVPQLPGIFILQASDNSLNDRGK